MPPHGLEDLLDELTDGLSAMARLAAVAVSGATSALTEGDLLAADRVISSDDAIDALRAALDQQAFDVLARRQPVASDLRAVLASLRIAGDLERVGDYAVHLARTAQRRHPAALPPPLRALVAEMGGRAAAITEQAAEVVAFRDLDAASRLLDADDEVDRLHRELLETLLRPGAWSTDDVVGMTLVARHYERLADHAVAVARSVHYVVTGGRQAADRAR